MWPGQRFTNMKLQAQVQTPAELAGSHIEPPEDHYWRSGKADSDYCHAPASAVEAWKDSKFGMRIHWGSYSVLGLDVSWPLFSASK